MLITYIDEIRERSCDESLKFRERLKADCFEFITLASRCSFWKLAVHQTQIVTRVQQRVSHYAYMYSIYAWSFEAPVWEILFRIKRFPDFQPSRASLNFCQVVTYSWMSVTVLPVAAVILCVSKTSNFLAVWTNLPETFESDRMDPDAKDREYFEPCANKFSAFFLSFFFNHNLTCFQEIHKILVNSTRREILINFTILSHKNGVTFGMIMCIRSETMFQIQCFTLFFPVFISLENTILFHT